MMSLTVLTAHKYRRQQQEVQAESNSDAAVGADADLSGTWEAQTSLPPAPEVRSEQGS